MKDDIEGRILWCIKQKKGLKITKPNDNLCNAYLKKANNSLKSMKLNMDAKLYEWAIDTAYYSRYHAVYALLQKCGFVSEIHDCSISVTAFLFKNEIGSLLEELETAKKQRIDVMYYTDRTVSEKDVKKNVHSAPDFVVSIEKIVSDLNNVDKINKLRSKLEKLIS